MKQLSKIIYISAFVDPKTYSRLFDKDKKPMHAASKYHALLCSGLCKNGIEVDSFSALPVTRTNCSKRYIKMPEYKSEKHTVKYATVFNIPGIKHIMLFTQSFLKTLFSSKKTVLMYDVLVVSAALGACLGAKLRGIEKIGIVTDIPEFQDIASNKYMFKINQFLLNQCDEYVFLTKQMNEKVNKNNKPYIVLEGHVDSQMKYREHIAFDQSQKKIVLYAGGLQKKYGIKALCEAFISMDKLDNTEELHIYGDGDFAKELIELTSRYPFIKYHGNVPNEVVVEAELSASLLVNPRPADAEFTKYSFPSKTMEYMASGTPVLMTRLPGMPEEYCRYVFLLDNHDVDSMSIKIREILDMPADKLQKTGSTARLFILNEKNNVVQSKKIIDFINQI